MQRHAVALIGEARGEHLFLREVALELRRLLGPDGALQIEMDPLDLTAAERANCLVPALEPEFRAAMSTDVRDLPQRVREAEARYGIDSLRRLWRGDIQCWRDGVDDHQMARQALGYVAVFDRWLREHPEIVGGYAEESARLIKRAFRAVALRHGRRMVASLGMVLPGRQALIESELLSAAMPDYDAFEPTPRELEIARDHIGRVRRSELTFGAPRDLQLDRGRVENLLRHTVRSLRRGEPGSHVLNVRYFARDFAKQRVRLMLLDRIARKAVRDASPFVFFPLHYSEDSQLSIRAEGYRDQLWLIRLIALSLPYGYRLLVKPHPAAPGDLPVTRLIRDARALGNVELVHPTVHAHHILREAKAVVVINSTTGFEALMFGVPLVTVGESVYRARGLTLDVDNPSEMSRVLAAALASPGPDAEAVERLIAYLARTTYELNQISQADLSPENAARCARALIQEFQLDGRPSRRMPVGQVTSSAARSEQPSLSRSRTDEH